MEVLDVSIRGVSPLLMNAATLSDPLHPLKKEISEYTKKRTRTDADELEIRRLEYQAHIYYDSKVGVFIPGYCIHACIREGAKKYKLGKAFVESCVILDDKIPLIYRGPKTPEKLFEKDGYVDQRTVVQQRSRVMRTRPRFNDWRLEFSIHFDDDIFNLDDLELAIEHAGRCKGLMDYRPLFGRFEIA